MNMFVVWTKAWPEHTSLWPKEWTSLSDEDLDIHTSQILSKVKDVPEPNVEVHAAVALISSLSSSAKVRTSFVRQGVYEALLPLYSINFTNRLFSIHKDISLSYTYLKMYGPRKDFNWQKLLNASVAFLPNIRDDVIALRQDLSLINLILAGDPEALKNAEKSAASSRENVEQATVRLLKLRDQLPNQQSKNLTTMTATLIVRDVINEKGDVSDLWVDTLFRAKLVHAQRYSFVYMSL